jgi:excisionase family DNA binding protein
MSKNDDWKTVREIASELRVSAATVRRLIWAKRLKASRVGRSVRISSRELERFLAAGGAA